MINVLFAVNETTWGLLKQNFQRDEDGNRLRTDLTDSQARKLRHNVSGFWKTPEIGGQNYHVVSWDVPEIYGDGTIPFPVMADGLRWVEFLLTEFPNKFHIIGAWNTDGSMFGTEIAQVENGVNSVETQTKVVTPTDKEIIDIEATIANQVLTMKTIQVDVITYEPSGEFIDVPHYDEVTEGTPIYPIHAQYMKIFPDVDGNPATVPTNVNKNFGRGDRRWSI